MTTGDMDIVQALIAALRTRVGSQRCGLWFGNQPRLELRGDTLRVGVPNAFYQDWLQSKSPKLRRELEACCEEVLGRRTRLVFIVDASLAEAAPAASENNDAASIAAAQVAGSNTVTAPRLAQTPETTRAANSHSRNDGSPTRGEKLQRRYADFSTFVVGPSNRVAFGTAQDVAENPGCMTPLYLYGETGVGKTHLLEAVASAAVSAQPRTRTLFVSAEQFTNDFSEALRGGGFPIFRQKYRQVGLLIVDDIHFLCGKTRTAEEFLTTIKAVLREGRQVVLSGNCPPNELTDLGAELVSHISGGTAYPIRTPDHTVRLGIVKQLCEARKVELGDDIQEMIAARLTAHARQLSGAVNRLHATARATGEAMTLAVAERELADMTMHNGHVVHLPEIEKAVCDVFGLQAESLRSDRKSRTVSQPRMLAMWLARKHTRSALSEIGDYFGRRSHTTVISAQKRVHSWMAEGAAIGGADQHWNAEEVIRRVEAKLRVG